jgi:hypothetical protein
VTTVVQPGRIRRPVEGCRLTEGFDVIRPVRYPSFAGPKTGPTYLLAALTLAHRALWAAAILLRPAAERVRFLRVETDFDFVPRM